MVTPAVGAWCPIRKTECKGKNAANSDGFAKRCSPRGDSWFAILTPKSV
jgi:hypothetical protein